MRTILELEFHKSQPGRKKMEKVGRPREFDEREVLLRALVAFWQHGYHGTTTAMLLDATDISASSLYGTFGSKRDLYLAALDAYRDDLDEVMSPLEAGERGLDDIEEYLENLVRAARPDGARGCLLINAMADIDTRDPEITRRADDYLARLRAGFERALGDAVDLGEVPPRESERLLALLTTALVGSLVASSASDRGIDADLIGAIRSTVRAIRS
jgi:TetR/AcrR family transcriptional regulator, copper-responsive repressor